MIRVIFALFLTIVLLLSISEIGFSAQAKTLTGRGKKVIEPFDYRGVKLGLGSLRRQVDEVRDFYLRIPNDDILRDYRLRAGLSTPGNDLGGFYAGHNPFGQWLSGLARMYAATGDVACREKAVTLMHGWAECIEPDGFSLLTRAPELRPYYYDKMVGGLVDIYLYCHDKDALSYLSKITDWAIKNMSKERPYACPVGPGGGEWYTLSENLYRAYLATGDTKYRDFAEVYEYTEFWDYFAKNADIFQNPYGIKAYHAYSHVNSLNGLGAAYLVKGDSHYLTALKNAYEFLWKNELWATGGYGPNEALVPHEQLTSLLGSTENHFETQCGSWAGFKMSNYLISLTCDAKYGDWAELLILNGIGASIPMATDGSVQYYSGYSSSGAAKKDINPWTCCTGTRIQAVADYHNLIYMKDEDNLYVVQFASSAVQWTHKGGDVTITQSTRFPEVSETEIRVSVAKPMEFGIKIRVPGWLAGKMTASVNGKSVPVKLETGHWATFHQTWHNGDTLALGLPMEFRLNRIDEKSEYRAAIMYGPVTMAVRCLDKNTADKLKSVDFAKSLIPVKGQALNFRLDSDPSILVRPYYQFKSGETYYMYLDPKTP